jgi:ankyrin repeat protein
MPDEPPAASSPPTGSQTPRPGAATPTSLRFEAPLFLLGFALSFWLWAKWLFSPQLFFLPPLPPVEVLISLVEGVLGPWIVALLNLLAALLVAFDGVRSRRAGRSAWWAKSLARGAAETVAIHVVVWIAGSIVFFALLAFAPGSDLGGRGTDDPVVRGLILFCAFLSLIVSGPVTGIVVGARALGRQRREGFPAGKLEALNHTVATLLVPLLVLWVISGYPRATLLALQQSSGNKEKERAAALVAAAREGEVARVRDLLARGVSASAVDGSGSSALMAAAANGHLECVHALLRDGAGFNARDPSGRTALMSACANRQVEILRTLLAAKAEVNAQDAEGKTGLMLAASAGSADVVQALLESGADVRAASSTGETALIAAIRGGYAEIVRSLIRAGADVNAHDQNGESALKMALKFNRVEVVRTLREAGAKE